ncbi:dapb3 [Symbiodinium natans]|uniref:Dapb3 protein n=1 Tax=Symbiodinium natans TaxID=878477 RepID=A0A812SPS2_9DINO|nr:dapb3 [Symbiodinium natans]
MPTAEAPFLTPTVQPLLLSPDGERTARFEFSEPGIVIRVEAAPSFGSEEAERRAGKQKVERITIIPRAKVGVMGVRDLFWLDGGSFLITGYEGPSGRFYGWIADLRRGKASVIKLPSSEANLFVPLGRSGLPMTRASAESQEVLVGFTVPDGASTNFSWTWCSTLSGDTADAGDGLATSEWREVALSKQGNIDAVLLSNGTVLRRSGDGWLDLGALDLDAAALSASLASQPLLPQEHLVSTTPRGALVIDTAAGGNLPEHHPQAGDLDSDIQRAEDSDLATWVLEQAVLRQTSALVRLSAEKAPQPIFVHPFADVLASGVWINPDTEDVEAVSVQDLKPKTYSLSSEHSRQLQSLRAHLPAEIQLYDVPVATAAMELVSLQTHGERCVAFFAHPLLSDLVALPAVVKAGKFTWLGRSALPTRGAALNSAAAALKPKLEGHRIPSSDGTSVPAYLLVPSQGAGALVVRLHDGPDLRDSWGTDSFDAWLLSRGYGILKVNYRGSAGFGRAWRASRGFAEDIASAIEWAVAERKVLGAARAEAGAAGGVPPVALVGSYFGGYAALHTASRLREWAACVVAIAPLQAAPGGVWSEPYIPRAESQGNLEPATLVGDLQGMAMMLVEYECDDSNGPLAAKLIPVGCDPEEWPTSVQYVQYAGERKGGGVVRQNMLDLYRRMDSFLHAELSERAGPRGLLREDFVDEVPFLSAALLPATAGSSSASGESIEIGLERVLRQSKGDDIADALPELRSAFGTPAGVGFSAEGTAAKQFGKRLQHMLVAPASRVVVREDGTIEVTVSFTEAPQKLHVLLSEVWMHIRAEGLGFTLALPRQPKRGQRIQAFALPSGTGFHFEIPGEANVGAVENFNYWAARGSSLLDLVLPEDLTAAAVLVPTVST